MEGEQHTRLGRVPILSGLDLWLRCIPADTSLCLGLQRGLQWLLQEGAGMKRNPPNLQKPYIFGMKGLRKLKGPDVA